MASDGRNARLALCMLYSPQAGAQNLMLQPVHWTVLFRLQRHCLLLCPSLCCAAVENGDCSMNDNVGGAETELRLHSMERVFCSQTLATPTLGVGKHLLAAGCAQAIQWVCKQLNRIVLAKAGGTWKRQCLSSCLL